MPEEWGNSPFDRLRNEVLSALERQTTRLEKKIDDDIKELKDTKAAKWVETALATVLGGVVMAVVMAVVALVIRPGP